MAVINHSTSNNPITAQTFYDLTNWLSEGESFSNEQLQRLVKEEHYLPLVSLANNFWLIGALCTQLKYKNVWDKLPHSFIDYLSVIDEVYMKRSVAIKNEAVLVGKILTQSNIDIVVLKGAAHLFNGAASPISIRFMVDIDLLIPEEQIETAVNQLKKHGFVEKSDQFELVAVDHHHAAPLIRPNGICYIELHRRALKKNIEAILTTEEIWQQCTVLQLDDELAVKQLNPSQQIVMAIAHSELSDRHFESKNIELKQLYNIYRLCCHFNKQINWSIVHQHFERFDKLNVLAVVMYNLSAFFQFTTPITDKNNLFAQQYLVDAIVRYTKKQGQLTLSDKLLDIFKGYSKSTVLYYYGNKSDYPVFRGRYLHFKRHMQLIFHWLTSYFTKRKFL